MTYRISRSLLVTEEGLETRSPDFPSSATVTAANVIFVQGSKNYAFKKSLFYLSFMLSFSFRK